MEQNDQNSIENNEEKKVQIPQVPPPQNRESNEAPTSEETPTETNSETSAAVSTPTQVDDGKVQELESKVSELESQLEAKNSEITNLQGEIESSKSNQGAIEEKDLKIKELNGKIEDLTGQVEKLKSEKDEIQADADTARTEVNGLKSQINQLQAELTDVKSSGGNLQELQEEIKVLKILASTESQALDMYNILKEYQSMNLRKLSMQSGMSSQAALSLLEGLERNGLVRFERAGADDTDPKISIAK